MTDLTERLAEALAACDTATEGPWYANDRGIGWEIGSAPKSDEPGYWPPTINEGLRETFEKPDAAFIAAARTGYPAALKALQAVLEIHHPSVKWYPGSNQRVELCRSDEEHWPCPTVQTIAEHLEATP